MRYTFGCTVKRKTLEVVSYLRESELDIFEHSWVPMRYTLLDIARDLGLKGMKGGEQELIHSASITKNVW